MQAWISSLTFLAVIILIVSNRLSPAVAALAGALALIYGGVFTLSEAAAQMTSAHATLALLLGAMVLARTLQPTGIFIKLARVMFIAARGRCSRLLIGLTLAAVAVSAFLPNATAVLVLGPVLLPLADELKLQNQPLLILLALAANSGGLLTMVGDPATYLISQAAGVGFPMYLRIFSWSGVVAVGVLLLLLPWCWRDIWTRELPHGVAETPPQVQLPWRAFLPIVAVGSGMLIFFLAGELLRVPFSPELVALSAACAALALGERFGLGSVADVLRDIDWNTLIFFACTFILTGALETTGVVQATADVIGASVTVYPHLAVFILLMGSALLSSVVPNIPLMAALIPLIQVLGAEKGQLLPLYAALLLGGTLGGNATMVGASANMVAIGITRQNGTPILFGAFLRYGLPVCLAQLSAVCLYLMLMSAL